MYLWRHLWITWTAILVLVVGLDAQNVTLSFEFEGASVQPGTDQHFTVSLIDGIGLATSIPCVVFHGSQPGPTLGITAGVHGFEYAPILAAQRLLKDWNATPLRGTIILVLIANPPSYLGRSPFVNPLDDTNLNRAFPGHPNGTLTLRMANWITKKVHSRCDFFVDMHSGDAPEDLMPYVAYYHRETNSTTANATNYSNISAQGRAMASSMGMDHVIVFNTTGKDYMEYNQPALYCSAQAYKLGIPSVDIECGRLGRVEPVVVDKIVLAMQRLLIHLDMMDGPVTSSEDKNPINYIHTRSFLVSKHTGIWYPTTKAGDSIEKGEIIGTVTDFFGNLLEEVQADASGLILYILGTPPVNQGDSLVSIGILEKEDIEE